MSLFATDCTDYADFFLIFLRKSVQSLPAGRQGVATFFLFGFYGQTLTNGYQF